MPGWLRQRRLVPALLLCGLIGPFGAHRFYAGKIITGTLQLLSTLSIAGWVLVDFPYHNGDVDFILLCGQLMALLIVGIWPSIDFCQLLGGKFTDRDGNPITE